jgi:thioredoxin-related protein
MKKLILAFALFFTMTTTAMAAELIMFSMASCGYCQAFLKEVAPTYADSEAAKLLPLRIISMDRRTAPKWYDKAYNARKIDGIAGTPTFVVFDNGEERARLIGYNGKERFYEDITNFIESNRKPLERTVGKRTIPYEAETEVDYKSALIQKEDKVTTPFVPFQPELTTPPKYEGKSENPHNGKIQKFPNGVYKSRDIMDHQYNTETEAVIAAEFLGCTGTHTHIINAKVVHMPCSME